MMARMTPTRYGFTTERNTYLQLVPWFMQRAIVGHDPWLPLGLKDASGFLGILGVVRVVGGNG